MLLSKSSNKTFAKHPSPQAPPSLRRAGVCVIFTLRDYTTTSHSAHPGTSSTTPPDRTFDDKLLYYNTRDISTTGNMSFDRSANLESQPTTWRRSDDPQYADDPEFRSFTHELSEKLFTLTSNITRLNNEIALLGTKRGTERVRERVQTLISETSDGFKEVGEGLKKVAQWQDLGPSQKFTQSKLNREFKASLGEFQVLQRQAIEKERASATAARAALEEGQEGGEGAEGEGGQQQQIQEQELRLADQSQVDFQESLIIERETEIQNIERGVLELNELFRDVAHMVHSQGEQLDIISENVEGVRDDTQGADRELRTASRHQKASRNKACCLLVILAVVLTIIILAVVLG